MRSARAVLLADGTSDEPLGGHVAALAREAGLRLDVTTPDFARMDSRPGRTVLGRLRQLLTIDPEFDVLIVHRDAESDAPATRLEEVEAALSDVGLEWETIPVIPIRMTEAWLLLDEEAIRMVAGKPSARQSLGLPSLNRVESVADAKAILQEALAQACGLSGRRLSEFKRDFPAHRRQLLDRLDRKGPVTQLSAWQALEAAVRRSAERLLDA